MSLTEAVCTSTAGPGQTFTVATNEIRGKNLGYVTKRPATSTNSTATTFPVRENQSREGDAGWELPEDDEIRLFPKRPSTFDKDQAAGMI